MKLKRKLLISAFILSILFSIIAMNAYKNYNQSSITTKPQTTSEPSNTSSSSNNSSLIKATDFKLKDLEGNEVSLSQLKGKKVFLNFWATWCPPCKAEMPFIEKIYQETKDSDLVIISVNVGEDAQTVKAFMNSNGYHFTALLDTENKASAIYNITAIPTSIFIDKNGYIVKTHTGTLSYEDMKNNLNIINN